MMATYQLRPWGYRASETVGRPNVVYRSYWDMSDQEREVNAARAQMTPAEYREVMTRPIGRIRKWEAMPEEEAGS